MSCPPKFKDLHKAADDAISKDFHSNCFNNKLKQAYCMGDMGSGEMTAKLNYNTTTGKNASEVEFKHKYSSAGPLGKFFGGVTATKTISDGSDQVKVKLEKSCSSGAKVTLNMNSSMAWAFSKPDVTIDYGKDKLTSQVNITPKSDFSGMDKASLNAVIAAGGAHIGFHAGYGFDKSNVDHAFKLAKNQNGCNVALGLANANDVTCVISKNVNLHHNFMNFISYDITALHSKTNYSVKSGDWGSILCAEYNNAKLGDLVMNKGKMMLDLKTLDYSERATCKINDNFSFSWGAKSNISGFWDNFKLGYNLEFSA